jgi:hypothetical protein
MRRVQARPGQACALIPGTSRSGATIIGGLLFGLSRKAATEFSFFLAIPTLMAASAYQLYKERHLLASTTSGCGRSASSPPSSRPSSACAGCCASSRTHDFTIFAWYRIAFGIVVLATWHRGGGGAAAPACGADLFPPQGPRPLPQGAADILQAALAGLEKKRQQALAIERMVDELKRPALPPSSRRCRNCSTSPTATAARPRRWKPPAARPACRRRACCSTAARSLDPRLPPRPLPVRVFPARAAPASRQPSAGARRPAAGGGRRVFHRRCATTEIDDAFSVTPKARRRLAHRHPHRRAGLGFGRIRPLAASPANGCPRCICRAQDHHAAGGRGRAFHAGAGRDCPALSLYLDVAADCACSATKRASSACPVVANLRHHDIEPLFNETTLAAGLPRVPFATS